MRLVPALSKGLVLSLLLVTASTIPLRSVRTASEHYGHVAMAREEDDGDMAEWRGARLYASSCSLVSQSSLASFPHLPPSSPSHDAAIMRDRDRPPGPPPSSPPRPLRIALPLPSIRSPVDPAAALSASDVMLHTSSSMALPESDVAEEMLASMTPPPTKDIVLSSADPTCVIQPRVARPKANAVSTTASKKRVRTSGSNSRPPKKPRIPPTLAQKE
ncbi:uncharacterized protein V1518DRAFT_426510 [Limtongia smithiae]|uniref:uncharacterized protein n=1 Tax=Limtongia smithiae TaxID=1125753 RepID=UPI0034CF3948